MKRMSKRRTKGRKTYRVKAASSFVGKPYKTFPIPYSICALYATTTARCGFFAHCMQWRLLRDADSLRTVCNSVHCAMRILCALYATSTARCGLFAHCMQQRPLRYADSLRTMQSQPRNGHCAMRRRFTPLRVQSLPMLYATRTMQIPRIVNVDSTAIHE